MRHDDTVIVFCCNFLNKFFFRHNYWLEFKEKTHWKRKKKIHSIDTYSDAFFVIFSTGNRLSSSSLNFAELKWVETSPTKCTLIDQRKFSQQFNTLNFESFDHDSYEDMQEFFCYIRIKMNTLLDTVRWKMSRRDDETLKLLFTVLQWKNFFFLQNCAHSLLVWMQNGS